MGIFDLHQARLQARNVEVFPSLHISDVRETAFWWLVP
jgi:hypothetical protein